MKKKCNTCWNYNYGICTRGRDPREYQYKNCEFHKLPNKKIIIQKPKKTRKEKEIILTNNFAQFFKKGGHYNCRTGEFKIEE